MSDTIAAIATPAQPGAIGILRLSGTGTCAALDAVFRAKNGKNAGAQRSRTMVLGELLDETGQVIDNVLCVVFPAPHSYTGEDCAELHCHGSPIVLDAGLRALFAAGCRQATGGEFTKRAFLLQRQEMLDTLRRAQGELESLVAGFSRGRLMKLGVPTVLLGKPNAGKSSLLNALLGYDRAIVTDVAGTTRDTVEEKAEVGGVLLRLIDTAGIRQGVERSRAAAKRASLAVLVLDGSRPLTQEDEDAIALAQTVPHLIVAVNKSDLPRAVDIGGLADRFDNVASVSAATGEGLDVLTDAIAAQFPAGSTASGALLTNARQADAANRALSAVAEARSALRIGMTADVVLTDCESALAALGELNGKQVRDDLIDTIFSRFCVGK